MIELILFLALGALILVGGFIALAVVLGVVLGTVGAVVSSAHIDPKQPVSGRAFAITAVAVCMGLILLGARSGLDPVEILLISGIMIPPVAVVVAVLVWRDKLRAWGWRNWPALKESP